MSDDNDIRAALGSLVHAVDHLTKLVEDTRVEVARVAPGIATLRRVDQLAQDLDAVLSLVPGAMRQAATEPPLSLMVGDKLSTLADDVERTLAGRRAPAGKLVG